MQTLLNSDAVFFFTLLLRGKAADRKPSARPYCLYPLSSAPGYFVRNLFKGEKINKFRGMWLYWDCWNWMRALSQVHPHQWLCWCFSPPGKSESPTSFQAGISLSRPKADGWLVGCLAGFLSVIFHRGPWDDKVKHSRSSGIGLCGLPIQILSCVYSKDPMGVWHFFLFAFLFQQAQFHLAAQFDFFIFYQGG